MKFESVSDIPDLEQFYAIVSGGEFVRWDIYENVLNIFTLKEHYISFEETRWSYKSTFIGNGKLHVNFNHNGYREFSFRILPLDERQGNEVLFLLKKNGPLNVNKYPFSDCFGGWRHLAKF